VTSSTERTGLISNVIRRTLDIECAVLMGANVAREVSIECFCEATIGSSHDVLLSITLQLSVILSIISDLSDTYQ